MSSQYSTTNENPFVTTSLGDDTEYSEGSNDGWGLAERELVSVGLFEILDVKFTFGVCNDGDRIEVVCIDGVRIDGVRIDGGEFKLDKDGVFCGFKDIIYSIYVYIQTYK